MGRIEIAALAIAVIMGTAVLTTAVDCAIKMFVTWMNDKYEGQKEV